MSKSKILLMKIVADKKTGRLLGIQVTGPGEGAKRIDVAATAITAGMTLDQIAHLDLSYAPPYSSAMDNLITAANVARNKRDGYMVGISAESVQPKMQNGDDFVFLDVRSPEEYGQVHLPKSTLIPLDQFKIDRIAPCHCTGFRGQIALWQKFGKAFVINSTGDRLEC